MMPDPFSSLAGLLSLIQILVVASAHAKSHKHNVAALTRRIKMLVPLIEEVLGTKEGDKEREMTEAEQVSFENLHLAIERAKDLIEKCGERSKMYMMFRGTGIIEKFKDVSLDLDRCLHALPLVNLKVSDNIQQQVQSVSEELRRAKYTIDEMDQKLSVDIALVLKEQREGLEANQALMRQLAEKLELTTHEKVMAEARALEIEKEEVRSEKNRQEEAYIAQIINLLSVMDTSQEAGPSGTRAEPPLEAPGGSLRLKVPPVAPEEFKCPLSLELMADPVVIASGQTFERAYIRRWWSQGHRTCPITNLPLNNLELIPNFNLKRMISDWCDSHGQAQPTAPVLSPPHSPTLRFMSEEVPPPFGKASGDEDEVWSKSGPMTVPDRGSGEFGKGGKSAGESSKGKHIVTLSDMQGGRPQKAGFEHLREGPIAMTHTTPASIAYDRHEQAPNEIGRLSLDEDVVTGEVKPGLGSPFLGPRSVRTFRTFTTGSDSSRKSDEDGEASRGLQLSMSGLSMSSEFKVSKAAEDGPGHRRNSSAPLNEGTGSEMPRHVNLQASLAEEEPEPALKDGTPPTASSPNTPLQAASELYSETLADASPRSLHHSLEDIRSPPGIKASSELWSEEVGNLSPTFKSDHGIRIIRHHSMSSSTTSDPHFLRTRSSCNRPAVQPSHASLSLLQASRAPPGSHHLKPPPPASDKQHASEPPTPLRSLTAHPRYSTLQVAAAHALANRGEVTEDLSHCHFGPPPPPPSTLVKASSTGGLERQQRSRHSEEGGHFAADVAPKFPPPSPDHSEYPVAVTPSGHALRLNSVNVSTIRDAAADSKRPVTPEELQVKARELRSGKYELIKAAAGDLRMLAKFSMENRKAIADAGVIPDLIGLLLCKDLKTQENAVTALLNLSIHDGNKATIANDGAIPRLVEVLQDGSQEAKENAAATLFSLSVLEECKMQIGAEPGAILGLVDLLKIGSSLGKKDATTALFNLSICHENKSRIVRNGAVGPLIQLIRDASLQEKVVAVLANLTTIGEGRLAITEANGIKALVAVTERGTPRSKENAAAALLQLCINSSRHTAEIYQEGIVPTLMSLQHTGTTRARDKARLLLRHFRDNLQDTVKP